MLFPISDDDRHLSKPAYVSISLLILNVALFLYHQSNEAFTNGWSLVPREITGGEDLVGDFAVGEQGFLTLYAGPQPVYLTFLSSMFMHGGWAHLGGNLLYLWIFGDNVEHRFGSLKFLVFYLISGVAASAVQIAMAPQSIIPTLGASGAISGILGAYLVLFPRNRVNAVFFVRIISVPAILVLGMWGAMQIFGGWGSLESVGESGGVAYGAHIGGFVAGIIVGLIARVALKEEPTSMLYASDKKSRRLW